MKKLAAAILLIISLTIFIFVCQPLYSNINYKINRKLFSVSNISNCHNHTTAPDDGTVGLWKGTGNTNDNQSDYYIVHDYTYYGKNILKSKINDNFTIKYKNYKIYQIIYVNKNTDYKDIKNKVMPGGETAAIQVCVPNKNYYKIVIAQ